MATDSRKPGVYVEESLINNGGNTGNANTTAFFTGVAATGPTYSPVLCNSWPEYVRIFGGFNTVVDAAPGSETDKILSYLPYAVYSYFQNGGRPCWVQRAVSNADGAARGLPASAPVLGDGTVMTLTAANKAKKLAVADDNLAFINSTTPHGLAAAPHTVVLSSTGTSALNGNKTATGYSAGTPGCSTTSFGFAYTGTADVGTEVSVVGTQHATTTATVTVNADLTSAGLDLNVGDPVHISGLGAEYDGTFVVDSLPAAANDVKTLTVTADGGTYTLTVNGQTTAAIVYNALAAAVESALELLSSVGVGGVSVTGGVGGAAPTPYTITFDGDSAGKNFVVSSTTTNLTGTGKTAVLATTTSGGHRIAYTCGSSNDAATPVTISGAKTVLVPVAIVAGKAVSAEATAFTVQAKSAADLTGSDILSFTLTEPVPGSAIYTLTVYKGAYGQREQYETFRNLTLTDTGELGTKAVNTAINDPYAGSALIEIVDYSDTVTPFTYPDPVELTGGANPYLPDSADLVSCTVNGNRTGNEGGGGVSMTEGPLLVNITGYRRIVVGEDPTYTLAVASSADFPERQDLFIINDGEAPRGTSVSSESYMNTLSGPGTTLGGNNTDSYSASYAPWIVIANPKGSGTVTVPPGGAVAGVFGRVDATQGVFRAPAGTVAGINTAIGVDTKFTDAQLGELNSKGINVIRPIPGVGMAIMGARTRKQYGADHYVSGRRTLIYIKETLRRATEFALFENNDQNLWAQLTMTAERFLRPLWLEGGLKGANAAEAYYIRCDSTINTPQVIASGEVRMEIGVALQYPAEFIIIKVSQFDKTSTFTEAQPTG